MGSKSIMTASTFLLGIIGVMLTFLPQETSTFFNVEVTTFSTVALQFLGSFYLGFAVLNWMAKGSVIGGVYGRPITIGNFIHFTIAGITLIKTASHFSRHEIILFALVALYGVFAIAFAYLFISHPGKVRTSILGK